MSSAPSCPSESVIGQLGPIDKQLLDACIHCGLCLPACPTYLATGREMESPRGRIQLLAQWNSGEQALTPDLTKHIDSCLGCLGCETACPSGVKYESILSAARPHIAELRPAAQRNLLRFAFKFVLPNYSLLQLGGVFLRLWQRSGLSKVLAWIAAPTAAYERAGEAEQLINPLRILLYRLHVMESFLPHVPDWKPLPTNVSGAKETKVQLFSGCVMDVFYNHVNHACMRLLKAQGNSVDVPAQGCCGALAMHAGEDDIARELARKNIEFFEKTEGPIVVTAAGCGAMLKEYPHLFHGEESWKARATQLAGRCKDITEALSCEQFPAASQKGFEAKFGKDVTLAYHAACHLAHAQKVRQAPDDLIQKSKTDLGAAALKLIPLRESEHCCGSAGIYNLINTGLSLKVLERKMRFIEQTGANVVVTTNPGCMLQLEAGVRKNGVHITVAHLAELLDSIYCSDV